VNWEAHGSRGSLCKKGNDRKGASEMEVASWIFLCLGEISQEAPLLQGSTCSARQPAVSPDPAFRD